MSVRAKFKVETVTQDESGSRVSLTPVTGGSKENEKFFRFTPFGSIEMGTINKEVAKQFVPGDEFYVDFTKV
ncbi:hypothetical protein AS1_14 [Marinobacter phage AS1]|nr:hypothetical protein AS1_14 [Marinobacter phage AS1]